MFMVNRVVCRIKCPYAINNFSKVQVVFKENLTQAKKFKLSSQKWLLRQLNDNYVKQAKMEHYRCRSAFKLVEIQEKYKLLRPGHVVVDLGCAPGSWTQVAVRETKAYISGSESLVVGVDLSPVHTLEGAILLSGLDVTAETTRHRLAEVLAGRPVNVVLSDMAPAATGIKSLDHTNIVKLCYSALTFAQETSCHGGSLVMKLFDGGDSKQLIADCKALYQIVRIVRPAASRKESSELFLACFNLKGSIKNDESVIPKENRTKEEKS